VTGKLFCNRNGGGEVVEEASLEQTGTGLRPTGEGWFVVSVRDARWMRHEVFGAGCPFGGPEAGFREFGINLRVLEPGQPNGLYHRESQQEDFLVLAGECTLLIEGEERLLRAWDFFHCPPDTEHIFVGAGSGPCVILMVGARSAQSQLFYPISELAQRYGAGVEQETNSPEEAYARFPEREAARPASWERLPWA
jgi:uncharacterized cupin superfamily protein